MTSTKEEFLATAIEQGTTESGVRWLLQSYKQTDKPNNNDVRPYVGAVEVPINAPLWGDDGRLDPDKLVALIGDDLAERTARGKGGAEGWIGIHYAGPYDVYDDAPDEEINATGQLLAMLTGQELTHWTKESVIADIKRVAELVAEVSK